MILNICMVVHNRPRLTDQALNSLITNTLTPFNLTIVDDCSDRKTRELWIDLIERCDQERPEIPAQVIRNEEQLGVGGSKNKAVRESERQFGRPGLLYLSDNDVYFTRGWDGVLLTLCNAWGSRLPKVFSGGCHPFLQPKETVQRYYPNGKEYLLQTRDAVDGPSMLTTWQTWDKYGPFDENARGVRQSEDWAFCQRVVKGGGLVAAVEPPVVLNCGLTDSFGGHGPGWELLRKQPFPQGVIYE